MKNILTILTLFCLTLACREDDTLKGPGVGFYPEVVASGQEEGTTVHSIALETSGVTTSDATITIDVSNGEFLTTVPPLSNNQISLVIPTGSRTVSFDVTVGDDNLSSDYSAIFKITGASGGVTDILPSDQFTLLITDNDVKPFFFDDFENCELTKWTAFSVSGSNDWRTEEFSGNTYADISNFSSTGIAEDWLIMPQINFDDFTGEKLSFLTQANFNNEGNVLEVSVLTDYSGTGDPSNANAIILNPVLDSNTDGFGDFTSSGILDLSEMTGTGHVAFHYTASSEGDGSGWQLDDVLLTANDPNGLIPDEEDCEPGGGGGGGGGGGSGGDLTIPFTDNFEGCADFAVPENWIEEVVPGSKTDRGWGCRSFGIDNSGAARASAFGGDEGTDDAWLISDGQFDLTSLTSIELKFWVEERFSGPGTLTVHWSTDYAGSGDPTAATWTELTDAATQILAVTPETFTEITVNLDAAAGNNIHLAFRYKDGTDAASVAYTMDDLSITGN